MAIVRTAGTEIIRCANFEEIDGSAGYTLIYGEQHHIYTVLSIVIYCESLQATTNPIDMYIRGYDVVAGTTARTCKIFRQVVSATETFVWDNKFSFNGHEPTDFTGPLTSVAEQNAIADQGSSVAQKLEMSTWHTDDNFDVVITYIDQNNS